MGFEESIPDLDDGFYLRDLSRYIDVGDASN
jgi:hypothetical protein